jgi:polysaccharide biosynthesis/export protein
MTMYRRMSLAIVMLIALASGIAAQTETPAQADPQKERPRTTTGQEKPGQEKKDATADNPSRPISVATDGQGQAVGDDGITSVYQNFFSTYKLGPEDVISVDVFNQERYSRKGIIIPPNGRISLALIPGGVFVNGKTTSEVADIIKKRYDEFIIDPEVTVSLDKAMSYRYSVMGDVLQPGVRLMSRRLTVAEAIAEAGGVLSTGDKSKVLVLRRQSTGLIEPIAVNVSAIYKGKAPDTLYLNPGDQIVVPGNKMKKFRDLMGLTSVLSFARIFGLPSPY